jgi:predicted permease
MSQFHTIVLFLDKAQQYVWSIPVIYIVNYCVISGLYWRLNYYLIPKTFKIVGFERAWRRLFQKHVVRTKLEIYRCFYFY